MTLRELRLRKFMTVTQLAEKLGVTRGTVWFWERGEWKPSMENLKKLHEIFGDDIFKAFK